MKISKQLRNTSSSNSNTTDNKITSTTASIIIFSLIQILGSIILLSSGGAILFSPCSAVRLARQSPQFFPSSSSSSSSSTEQHQWEASNSNSNNNNINNNNPVPYKTFYVSRACEWKSNLFVPKTNDILFAQSSHYSQQQQQSPQQPQPQPQPQHANQESSVSYFDTQATAATFNTAYSRQPATGFGNNYFSSRQSLAAGTSGPDPDGGGATSRTVLLSTDSKALVLALPTQTSQTFAGYEPACSIRLIVPRNMRILAKLSSRRLTFSQEQQFEAASPMDQPTGGAPMLSFDEIAQQQQQQPQPQLWLNVSQNQFIETEQRIIETEGNVLALRFLLDRFANRQQPDLRFQLVLTAFQTLGENSGDLSAANGGPNSQQIICDQQRLIAANLACDGFKNCQDGHDEEASTCALLNPPRTNWHQSNSLDTRNQISQSAGANETSGQQQADWIWTRVWSSVTRSESSLVGFLLGFLLVLLLLCCCTCCVYFCVFVVWRRHCLGRGRRAGAVEGRQQQQQPLKGRRQRNIQLAVAAAAAADHNQAEVESLAQAQNLENAARQQQQQKQAQKQMPPRLQSILKRPAASQQRPLEAPPAVPAAHSHRQQTKPASPGNRGALSSHLSSREGGGTSAVADFRPTPAKRLARPTRPVPVPVPVPQEVPQRIHHNQPPSSSTNQGGPPISTTMGTTTTSSSSYSYSSVGTIRYSEHTTYYDGSGQLVTGPVAPPSGANANYHKQRDSASVSPRASLI